MPTLQRVSLAPLRDGKYPTSQHWNALAGQINARVINNVHGTSTSGCFDRLHGLFGSIKQRFWDITKEPNLRVALGTLDNISTILSRPRENIRSIFDILSPSLFEGFFNVTGTVSRSWYKPGEDLTNRFLSGITGGIPQYTEFVQSYAEILNDEGTELKLPLAKWVAEVMSAFLCEACNGSTKSKSSGNYSVREIAPDFERLFTEKQFRFAHQVHFDELNDDITDATIVGTDYEMKEWGKDYCYFEIAGSGTYTITYLDNTEEEFVVDDYLWVDKGFISIRREGLSGAASAVALTKRGITYCDVFLLAYAYISQFTVAFLAESQVEQDQTTIISQQNILDAYFNKSEIVGDFSWLGLAKPLGWENAINYRGGGDNFAAFARWWADRNHGGLEVRLTEQIPVMSDWIYI